MIRCQHGDARDAELTVLDPPVGSLFVGIGIYVCMLEKYRCDTHLPNTFLMGAINRSGIFTVGY